jgi:hypothetical protein
MERQIGDGESVSAAVVLAVSEREGKDPRKMPPLGAAIDTDALDQLFTPDAMGAIENSGQVVFRYSDSLVTVKSTETLVVEALDSEPE